MQKTIIFLFLFGTLNLFGQVDFTANDTIYAYDGLYRPGVNPGYYGGNWNNFSLTDLAAGNAAVGVKGAGVKSIRGGLPESFALVWNYDTWKEIYDYYRALGVEDNTLFVGYAHPAHRDTVDYCPGDDIETEMFLNLYEPIWDNGENGTPVNEQNYYAKYIYLLAQKFGEDIRFWEVWNEPGFDLSGFKSWLQPGQAGNWWENNPEPCDIIIRAPFLNYLRTMRITYEVIKSIHPDAYVVLSGVGNDSFLDAILRNTDNPDDGSVTSDYPYKGGAYFDVMGFHVYPNIDGSIRAWSNELNGFEYFRYSDAAVDGYGQRIANRLVLLNDYGYDGTTYPKKLLTVTEINIPRIKFGESLGSDTLQRNYIIKAALYSLDNQVLQTHVFDLAERRKEEEAQSEFDVMGLYKNITDVMPYEQVINDEGIAYRTYSQLMFGASKDTALTNALNLPDTIRGGAYLRKNGELIYVLWAKTHIDLSEDAAATYSFPATVPSQLYQHDWNYGQTDLETLVSSQGLSLTGAPTFYTESPLANKKINLICPEGGLVEIAVPESEGGGIGSWVAPTVTSDCANAAIVLNVGQESGSFFPFGVHVVGYKATDDCGNEAYCSMLVKVASTGGEACHFHRWNFGFSGTFGGHNYFLSNEKKNWADAKAMCEDNGGYLVSIETPEENAFLKQQIYALSYIGLTDEGTEGELKWLSGEPFEYGVFDTDCDWCGLNTEENDYAFFHPWDGKMSMTPGTDLNYFLMEIPCRDCDCPSNNEPVCGADSTTYINACEAECHGVYVYDNGACWVKAEDLDIKTEFLDLFPNPVDDVLTLKWNLPKETQQDFIIYNTTGLEIQRIPITDHVMEVETSSLPVGVYWIRLNGQVMGSFVVVH